MDDLVVRVIASVVTAFLFCFSTVKLLGVAQQSGYKNGGVLRWLKRKDNLFYNRLAVLALCLALASAVVALCFSFLGTKGALICSAVPFFALCGFFYAVDGKYALKVPVKKTGRVCRLFGVYLLFTASAAFLLISLLYFLGVWNGSSLYALIAYTPFAVMPLLLPFLFCAANATLGVFENMRNKKFIKRAGQVLDETEILRVGIVGSYGKTSVKNILKALLSEKYAVVETPESYNTPMGIAKTVFSDGFAQKQVFIAEMGARKAGDIQELCEMVKPDYALFTGICEQHISTFGSLENVWEEKKQILYAVKKKAVCGASLKERVEKESLKAETLAFEDSVEIKEVRTYATETQFTLLIDGQELTVKTSLLGNSAVENVRLCVALAFEMGLTIEEIGRGLEKIKPIPHRLQLLENNGVYILDDGYNCNLKGAEEAIAALSRFEGRKCIVTPGIVECGILEEKINASLGEMIAKAEFDKTILVGETLVLTVKNGYLASGGEQENLVCVKTLSKAQEWLADWITAGDAVLFLNDLPDVY